MPSRKEKIGFRIEEGDDSIRNWLRPFREANLLSDVLRLLVYERTGDPLPDDLEFLQFKIGPARIEKMQTEIKDLQVMQESVIQEMQAIRDDIRKLTIEGGNQDVIARLEQNFEQLAQKVDKLSLKVETMQLTGDRPVGDDELTTPLIDPNEARQHALSLKLKGIQFNKLVQ
jgi:hypothetical protein